MKKAKSTSASVTVDERYKFEYEIAALRAEVAYLKECGRKKHKIIDELKDKLAVAEKRFLELALASERHLTTMEHINVHMGFHFTQPLIKFNKTLDKIRGGK